MTKPGYDLFKLSVTSSLKNNFFKQGFFYDERIVK